MIIMVNTMLFSPFPNCHNTIFGFFEHYTCKKFSQYCLNHVTDVKNKERWSQKDEPISTDKCKTKKKGKIVETCCVWEIKKEERDKMCVKERICGW